MNSESPGSPWWKRTSLRRKRRVRRPVARRSRVPRSSPANSCTRSSASIASPTPSMPPMVHADLSADRQLSRRCEVAEPPVRPRYSAGDLPVAHRPTPGHRSVVRLTVLGCGPAAPQPDTPASGLLVESGSSAILLDCGQGVAARLVGRIEPAALTAVVIGHMHADHFIDLSALRYGFAWGDRSAERLPVLLPPGGLALFAELAGVVSERPTFFDDAFDVREYDPAVEARVGDLELSFIPGRHYVPAWGVALRGRRRDEAGLCRGHRPEPRPRDGGPWRRPAGVRGDPRLGGRRRPGPAWPSQPRRGRGPRPAEPGSAGCW